MLSYRYSAVVCVFLPTIYAYGLLILFPAKNPNVEEVKYELSDFLYHAMVLMVEKGITWEDITGELADRYSAVVCDFLPTIYAYGLLILFPARKILSIFFFSSL